MSLSPLPVPAASLDGTASLLRAGGLVACPTETYFAVACDARNACAVDRVYQAKGRLATKPLPLVCADKDMVLAVTDLDLGAGKEQLHPAFFAFWPGPLTLVLKARAGFFNPKLVDARGKIALRVTPHPAARALAQTLGGPITATSANLQGRPPARLAGELDPDLLARLDCVFDAGPEPQGGLPSTIVEPLGGLKARILREGAVPACALAKQGIALA
ncbi:MAG: threonylcarbamoyl-AMP synthase [Desulfovibrio sp.]|nr:threonylcarbamoyl-AMP synthase [Desulfovibrio sp.]